ncbi:hypothetical protein DL96DRAFT_1613817, partial [Flagelloscypha sp. PMI_526]
THNPFRANMLVSQNTGASLVPSFRSLPGDNETTLASQHSPLPREEDPPEYSPTSFSGSQLEGIFSMNILPSRNPSPPSATSKGHLSSIPELPTPNVNGAPINSEHSFPASKGSLLPMASQSRPDLPDSPGFGGEIPLDLGIPEDGQPAKTSISRRLRKMFVYLKAHLQCKECSEQTREKRYGTSSPCSKCRSEYLALHKGNKYNRRLASSKTFLPTYEKSTPTTTRLVPPARLTALTSHSPRRYRSVTFTGPMGPIVPRAGGRFQPRAFVHPGEKPSAIPYRQYGYSRRMNRSGGRLH